MPTPTFSEYVVTMQAAQYQPGGSADFITLFNSIYGAGTAYLAGDGTTIINNLAAMHPTDWLTKDNNGVYAVWTNAQYTSWHEALYVAPSSQLSYGSATVPSIGAGGNTNVSVTLKPPMPNTTYTGTAWIVGSATLLGQIQANNPPTVVDASHMSINVSNTALLTVSGGTVNVIASN